MANEVKPTTFPVLGVDVSKGRLDAALTKAEGEFVCAAFGNDPAGLRALLAWARKQGAARCDLCLEPSGGYEFELCAKAHGRGHRVLLANAMRTANFRKSRHVRNKTDLDDARLLCEFALCMRLRPWSPPSPEALQLKELIRVRGHLVEEAAMHRGLLEKARTPAGRGGARSAAKAQQREADKIAGKIRQLLESTPEFAETARLLSTIPGPAVWRTTAGSSRTTMRSLQDHLPETDAYRGKVAKRRFRMARCTLASLEWASKVN